LHASAEKRGAMTENGESAAHHINDRGTIVDNSTNVNGRPTAVMWIRAND
jgi:hypothetical protein